MPKMAKPEKREKETSFTKDKHKKILPRASKNESCQSRIRKMPSKFWHGEFSKVRSHKKYVTKVLKKKDKDIYKSWFSEINALRACDSIVGVPQILSTSVDFDNHDYRIKMSRCPGYPIDYIYKHTSINEDTIFIIMSKLLTIIAKIHAIGFTHYDISLENIMYDDVTHEVSLIDFGFCTIGPIAHFYGTDAYVAPEISDNSIPYPKGTQKCDIYSAGICLYFLLCMNFRKYHKNLTLIQPFPWPSEVLSPLLTFLTEITKQMLMPEKQRPNAATIVERFIDYRK